MRFFLWLLVLLATAIGLAVTARFNPGNVVLFYPPYRIDLSLNFFLLLAVLVFLLLFLFIDAIRSTSAMPRKVAAYRRDKREREGNRALREALKALFEGRFGHAEKAATRAAELPDNAGLAALIGARAAHWMRQYERRDAWLVKAQETPLLKPARLMTTLELLVDEHKSEQALEAVRELNASGTRHIHALRLALKAHQYAHNWPEVLRLTRSLDKNDALHPAVSTRLRDMAYADLLSDRPHDAESIRRVWYGIPADERLRPFVAARGAAVFNANGLHDEARALIEKALAAQWDDRLVIAYRHSAATSASPSLVAQIERCEAWSVARPVDPQLALTLGALCLRQKLWGKAQRHLEQALAHARDAQTRREGHLTLAQLHEALGHADEAATHYRQSALAG
ncbi:MAG: heme biosynthesis protein HemY [Herminiimonas sp.]|nr:heme biosynthesis protein HemY [Herminiimonas sp.]